MKSLGIDCLRVPRHHNPFAIARQIKRAASSHSPELCTIRQIVEEDRSRRPFPPIPLPAPFPPESPLNPWCPVAEAS